MGNYLSLGYTVMASKGVFNRESMVSLGLIGGCLVATEVSKTVEIGSNVQKGLLAVAAVMAAAVVAREPVVGFILATIVFSYVVKAANRPAQLKKKFVPSEANKAAKLASFDHNTDVTLEEELVKKMLPFSSAVPGKASYQPVLGPQHLATDLA